MKSKEKEKLEELILGSLPRKKKDREIKDRRENVMQDIGIKKEKVSSTEMNEEMASKTRLDFLTSLVSRSTNHWTPGPNVDVVRFDGFPILTINRDYLYLNIGSKVQGLKTDNWEIYPCSGNKKALSLLIEIREIKDLLDEIIVNKTNYYYRGPDYDDKIVYVGIEQFLREA